MTFVTWLDAQSDRRDWIGQLSRIAAKDLTFPRQSWRLYRFLQWAEKARIKRVCVKAAHREWRQSRKVNAQ